MWFRGVSLLTEYCILSCIYATPIPSTSAENSCVRAFSRNTVCSGGCGEDAAYICKNNCKISQNQPVLTKLATRSAFAVLSKTLESYKHVPQDVLYYGSKKASSGNKHLNIDGFENDTYTYPWQQTLVNGTYKVSAAPPSAPTYNQ
jgi:hypothetical protein